MVIFKKLGINFVHAPKTGGSAVCRALATLEGNVEEFDRLYALRQQGQFHLTGLHSACDKELPGITAVFTREPGDLIESCFNYALHRNFFRGSAEDFIRLLETDLRAVPAPLSTYIHVGRNGYLKHCNFVGRFENLEEDFDRLTGTTGQLKVWNRIPKPGTFTPEQKKRAIKAWK